MSADAAKAVVRRFYTELFRDLASAEECINPDYVDHNNADAGHGPNVLRSHVAALLHTFPDFTIEIEDILPARRPPGRTMAPFRDPRSAFARASGCGSR
ncbi:ester cyclase [Sinorhizobium meliloti]|uniref:ester cyclase n=1 Tax=Rhizobium meliloti TaxID=382 RepID=UPI00299D601A